MISNLNIMQNGGRIQTQSNDILSDCVAFVPFVCFLRAEFRKTDRSLLVSPDGSSRVPFDPQQKPKCGVLKSPLTLRSASAKKTPNRKKSVSTPKSTPKRRPAAADFF